MSVAMPLPNLIDDSQTVEAFQRVLSAEFGGNYVQTAPDGSNTYFETVQVKWIPLVKADRDTVVAALKLGATDFILWTRFGESVQKKYIIAPNKVAKLYSESMWGIYFLISTEVRMVS